MQSFDENTNSCKPTCHPVDAYALSSHKISQLSNNMMKHTSTILLVFLGTLCLRTSAFARMSKPFLCMRKVQLHATLSHDATAGDDSLFDEEEAAAIDAHDISDPGMEAAAMERAVMLAAEYKKEQMKKNQMKQKQKQEDHIKAVEEHYKEVEKDISEIEHLIQEAADADHAPVSRIVASLSSVHMMCHFLFTSNVIIIFLFHQI